MPRLMVSRTSRTSEICCCYTAMVAQSRPRGGAASSRASISSSRESRSSRSPRMHATSRSTSQALMGTDAPAAEPLGSAVSCVEMSSSICFSLASSSGPGSRAWALVAAFAQIPSQRAAVEACSCSPRSPLSARCPPSGLRRVSCTSSAGGSSPSPRPCTSGSSPSSAASGFLFGFALTFSAPWWVARTTRRRQDEIALRRRWMDEQNL
jgi:hypothetical protein